MGFTSTTFSTPNCLFFPRRTFRKLEFRVWKRRRLKSPKPRLLCLRNELGPPSDFFSLLSQNWIPPAAAAALGFASAIALSLSSNQKKQIGVSDSNTRGLDIGESILFTSPTPFNRFVLLRCPSISFGGGEFLEDVNDKLVKEERHYVRLDSGRVRVKGERENEENEEELEYQRVCLGTDDGGVISLDWPANLDLNQEHGLDTTVLLILGAPEGSMDANVKSFVCECLKRGLFPVVMNPRGCAGSPLTTARLFTAADSDDICSAIQFITKARSWSTFMGVGWGYGANMLTKYLAEAGEKTPLTAATCIDNPFDLDEATRTSPYNTTIDKKLTRGLIDILKSNKELFQGRGKGFHVEKALLAESVRDFEEAISMISYGFDTLEEFYSSSSTRSLVGRLKIPVLFIQNDNGTVPLFSIPRGLIAENPFTSLLLCSCLPSNFTAISWYHQVTIEWLTAVELGLLKGRHPLLQDIDVTVNPSKSLALVEGRMPAANDRLDNVLNAAEFDSPDAYMDSMNGLLGKNGATAYVQFESNQFLEGKPNSDDEALSKKNGNNSIEASSPEDRESNLAESDRGQVLQTAQVVMNMLDATMPGTLKEEEKKKGLAAVARGETLIKALHDAVPEDVRGKLTSSVSEILQAQGLNLNFDGLLKVNQIANVSSALRSKIKEKSGNSDVRVEGDDHFSDKRVSARDVRDGSISQRNVDEHTGGVNGVQPQEEPANFSDLPESRSANVNGENMGSAEASGGAQNNGDKFDSDTSSKQKIGQFSEVGEDGSDATTEVSSSSSNTGTDCVEAIMQNDSSQDDEVGQPADKATNRSVRMASEQESSDQNQTGSPADARLSDTSEMPATTISDGQLAEKGDDDSKSKDERLVQPLPYQNTATDSRSLTFSVSQALDALTGLDDSTQAAVNSVLGVIEDVLTQLEEEKNDSAVKKENDNNDTNNHSVIKKSCIDFEIQKKQIHGDDNEDANRADVESAERNISNPKMENNTASVARKKNSGKKSFIINKLVAANAGTPTDISKLLLYAQSNPYTEAFDTEHLRKYMLSKVKKMQSLNLDIPTALFLDYNPEEGHWLLRQQPEDTHDIVLYNNGNRVENDPFFAKENIIDNVIEPSYVILDSEQEGELLEELKEKLNNNPVHHDFNMEKSELSVKNSVLDSLKVEVSRRLSATAMKELEADLEADVEEVASTLFLAIQHDKEHAPDCLYSSSNCNIQECIQLNGNHIVEVISQAVQNTSHLKRVLPVGAIVGSTLAALRNSFDVTGMHDHKNTSPLDIDQDQINDLKPEAELVRKSIQLPADEADHDPIPAKSFREKQDDMSSSFVDEDDRHKVQTKTQNRDALMVGAVTAALGASAILSQQEIFIGDGSSGTTCSYSKEKHVKTETAKDEEVVDDKQSNIVTSLAEKAMSVAAPIVPTKEGGEVDQERLVSMLAELGQKGGVLKLVGKLALLWGGLRGAMSLTDRLISFFRIAERPLLQRVLGFFGMALVLWCPVLVPLLPTFVHNWATQTSSRIVELACILGLYTAVAILIMQWGKRIRGHEYPLRQYGLDFMSSEKIQDFSTGFVGGTVLVLSVQCINALLGFAQLSWPLQLISSSVDLTTKMKAYGQLFLLAAQGILTAAGIAFVEELLFRSWLLEEIATDLGYQSAVLLSALAFSLSQRSLRAIPGLWLLSLALSGARLRKQGSLFIPIGMRTGIMASNFILQMGGFMTHQPNSHLWIGGTHPSQPFGGVVGLFFALLLAIILYPGQSGLTRKTPRTIRP